MAVIIYMFKVIGNTSVIDAVYVVASYTYGPLLGLYIFGLYSKRNVRDFWVPIICILSPIICLIIFVDRKLKPQCFNILSDMFLTVSHIYLLNPVTPIITTFRFAIFGFGYFNIVYYLISWVITLLVFFIGIVLFSKIERTFMDTI